MSQTPKCWKCKISFHLKCLLIFYTVCKFLELITNVVQYFLNTTVQKSILIKRCEIPKAFFPGIRFTSLNYISRRNVTGVLHNPFGMTNANLIEILLLWGHRFASYWTLLAKFHSSNLNLSGTLYVNFVLYKISSFSNFPLCKIVSSSFTNLVALFFFYPSKWHQFFLMFFIKLSNLLTSFGILGSKFRFLKKNSNLGPIRF